MRTTQEILAYVQDQIWYTEKKMEENGVEIPLFAKTSKKIAKDNLEKNYWIYQTLKEFIEGKI